MEQIKQDILDYLRIHPCTEPELIRALSQHSAGKVMTALLHLGDAIRTDGNGVLHVR